MGLMSLLLSLLTFRSLLGPSIPRDVAELAKMSTVDQILRFYGYPSNEITVKTSDGYYLTLNRIPNPGKHPVLLMHDFQGSAANFVMMGPTKDLAYLLYDQGYDVWLGNTRGSRFSRSNPKFHPKLKKNFWNFSWHEIGIYDLPAMINFILQISKQKNLSYIGFSAGAKEFFVMASLLPQYNKKIKVMHAIAPSVYMSYTRSKYWDIAKTFIQKQKPPYFGEFHLSPNVIQQACVGKYLKNKACSQFIFGLLGSASKHFNKTMLPVILNNYPTGSSMREFMHSYQVHETGIFAPFDEGFFKRRPKPKAPYPLENVTAPVALYYSKDDHFVGSADIEQLANELPNVVENYQIPARGWNHLDPLIALNAREVLYNRILNIEKKKWTRQNSLKSIKRLARLKRLKNYAAHVNTRQRHNENSIQVPHIKRNNGDLNVKNYLENNQLPDNKKNNGDPNVRNNLGDLKVENNQGNPNVKDNKINNGDTTVINNLGDLKVENYEGVPNVEEKKINNGEPNFKKDTGDPNIENYEEDLNLENNQLPDNKTNNGDPNVRNNLGDIKVENNQGDPNVEDKKTNNGDPNVKNSLGDIKVENNQGNSNVKDNKINNGDPNVKNHQGDPNLEKNQLSGNKTNNGDPNVEDKKINNGDSNAENYQGDSNVDSEWNNDEPNFRNHSGDPDSDSDNYQGDSNMEKNQLSDSEWNNGEPNSTNHPGDPSFESYQGDSNVESNQLSDSEPNQPADSNLENYQGDSSVDSASSRDSRVPRKAREDPYFLLDYLI